jgi:hypothetical protein
MLTPFNPPASLTLALQDLEQWAASMAGGLEMLSSALETGDAQQCLDMVLNWRDSFHNEGRLPRWVSDICYYAKSLAAQRPDASGLEEQVLRYAEFCAIFPMNTSGWTEDFAARYAAARWGDDESSQWYVDQMKTLLNPQEPLLTRAGVIARYRELEVSE